MTIPTFGCRSCVSGTAICSFLRDCRSDLTRPPRKQGERHGLTGRPGSIIMGSEAPNSYCRVHAEDTADNFWGGGRAQEANYYYRDGWFKAQATTAAQCHQPVVHLFER
ncbi:hypothetical protein FJTKL_04056 [Diaporthe vaccinii]|uniref:Uncharacterized protein n=1 Tax=Diaporthe vaccinii TaxID=105482 RepID=A0ABR4DU19_9PEZI